jgi:hypothetical protein
MVLFITDLTVLDLAASIITTYGVALQVEKEFVLV